MAGKATQLLPGCPHATRLRFHTPQERFMIRKLSVLCAATALLAAVPAHAQTKGQFLVEAGGGLPFYDSGLDLNDKIGFGGRLGYMFSDRIGLEGDIFYYSTEPNATGYTGPSMTEMPLHGRLTYNAPLGKSVSAILGLGATLNFWGGDSLKSWYNTTEDQDAGPGALVGLRFGGAHPFSVRVDWTGDYIINPFNETGPGNDSRFDMGVDLMLSLAFGGKQAPKDADMDGVVNKSDLCPNTPAGDKVDANGCSLPKDSDRDGVTDDKDRCPNTPAGTKVDANGCPFGDADKDGVTDNLDKCPNTPMGATVDATGCPGDQDGDKVLNGLDKCPDTPAGVAVNATGCPADEDGDGVPDYLDKCPNTPAGMQVRPSGCPVLFEPGKSAVVLEGVTFATNSATLDPTSTAILDRVANALQYNPAGAMIEVAGYTDNTGSRAHNMKLSQQRAEAVMNYLVGKGLPAAMFTAKGYGPQFPIDTNATEAGRANNRRVMLKQTAK
jgi:outer membrane protein OmpA-like peptidoglycan-associated protein